MSNKNQCLIYSLLWCMYSNQGFFGLGSIAQIILFVLILYSMYKFVYVNIKYNKVPFIQGLNFFFILLLAYGIYYYFFGKVKHIEQFGLDVDVPKFYYLKYVFASIPLIYAYYDFALKGVFNEVRTRFFYAIFIFVSAFLGFISYAMSRDAVALDGDISNNAAYKFVAFLPLILLIRRWQLPLLTASVIFIMLGMKRGAILIGVVCSIIILIAIYKRLPSLQKFLFFVLSIVAIYICVDFVADNLWDNPYFQKRLEQTLDGDSSGRDNLYEDLWDEFAKNDDIVTTLFGRGADATVDIAGNYAHNDWLELAINQGWLGLILFALFFILWIKNIYQMKKLRMSSDLVTCMGLNFLITFLMSCFSMAYTSFSFANGIGIGYCLACFYNKKYNSAIETASH